MDVVNLPAKFAKFADHWSPKIVAQVNDLHIKAVKLKGELVWHRHADTDEYRELRFHHGRHSGEPRRHERLGRRGRRRGVQRI